MKSVHGSRRSIRYSVLIGVLAGSVLAGSGAYADVVFITLEKTNVGGIGFGLDEIKANLGGDFKLESNIQITDLGIITNGTWDSFTGSLDGDGHTISGLTDSLFYNTNGASITNLVLRTEEISGINTTNNDVGILATAIRNTLVDNVQVYGDITGGNRIGGIVGESSDSRITNSNSYANVSGDYHIGGLVGNSINSEITNSTTNAEVIGFFQVGGLVGAGINTNILNSNVAGLVSGVYEIGGAIGYLEGNLTDGVFSSNVLTFSSNAEVQGRVLDSAGIGGVVGRGSTVNISNVEIFAPVSGLDYIGGVIGDSRNSKVNLATVITNVNGSAGIGGIIGDEWGALSTVTNSSVMGVITGNTSVGGVIGESNSNTTIQNSSFSGNVNALAYSAGGLVGAASGLATIQNSFALGNIQGQNQIGGLIGYTNRAEISNSYASTNASGSDYVGGLIGAGNSADLTNTFSKGTVTSNQYIGGLAGIINGNIDLRNTYSSSNLETLNFFAGAGLIGITYGDVNAINSYASGNLNAGFGGDRLFNAVGGVVSVVNDSDSNSQIRSFADIFGPTYEPGFNQDKTWGSCSKVNSGNPFLTLTYGKNPCVAISVINFGGYTEKIESNSIEEIQKSVGFKNEILLPRNALISFLEETVKIDIKKVRAAEIVPTANAQVDVKVGEALQISLKSESKEPVELWVKSPDGTWLLAGVITFDKDGKAILPPLQFKNAGDYTLVLNKPSADSAKGSAPLNQTGSLLVAVS